MTAVDANLLFAWLNRDHAWHGAAAAWLEKQSANSNLVLCELCLAELYGLLRNAAEQAPLENLWQLNWHRGHEPPQQRPGRK